MSHLPSGNGVELVRPEPMARKMRAVTGNLTKTMQFPKGQTEGQVPVESKKGITSKSANKHKQ